MCLAVCLLITSPSKKRPKLWQYNSASTLWSKVWLWVRPVGLRVGRGFEDFLTHFSMWSLKDCESYLISLGSQRPWQEQTWNSDLKSLVSQTRPKYTATNTLLEYFIRICVLSSGGPLPLVSILQVLHLLTPSPDITDWARIDTWPRGSASMS